MGDRSRPPPRAVARETCVKAFEPVRLGPITLKNRVIKAATFEGVTPDALVTDALIAFHRRVALGGAGMSTVAYLAVTSGGRTEARQIWWRPETLAGLLRLTDAVHGAGAKVSAQLGHAGPVADPWSTKTPAFGPSRRLGPLGITRAVADVESVIGAFGDAAAMAEQAGFDAVELHFGHGYLVSAFLSPRENRRTDEWGGSLEGRARLARAIAERVRERVGGRLAVTCKLNLEDGVRGGNTLADCVQVARWLETDGTVDAITLTAGSSLSNPMYLFRGDLPLDEFAAQFREPRRLALRLFGRVLFKHYPYEPLFLLPLAKAVRAAVKLPLVLLGGITDLAGINRALGEGFELVAMARALLKEPDLVNTMMRDSAARSTCTHCNRCMPTIYTRTRCPLNEETALSDPPVFQG